MCGCDELGRGIAGADGAVELLQHGAVMGGGKACRIIRLMLLVVEEIWSYMPVHHRPEFHANAFHFL